MSLDLGQEIRRLRESKGITLRELARRVGVSAPFLSDLEHGRRSTTHLASIAKELGVPFEQLEPLQFTTREEVAWLDAHPEMRAWLRKKMRKA